LRAGRSRVGEVEKEEDEESDDGEERTSSSEEVDRSEDDVAEEDDRVAAAAHQAGVGGATVVVERSLRDRTAPFPVRRESALLLPLGSRSSSAGKLRPERRSGVVCVTVLVFVGGFAEVTG
jgi:hypothetical protein